MINPCKWSSLHAHLQGKCLYILCMCVCTVHLCPALYKPMDCSLSGSSVRGIFQVRILEGVAIFFSRKSSPPRDWNCVSSHFLCWQADSLLLCHLGRCLERHYVYMLFFPDLILLLALLEQFYFISFTDLHCISKEEWHVPIFIEVIFRKVNEERNRRSSLS